MRQTVGVYLQERSNKEQNFTSFAFDLSITGCPSFIEPTQNPSSPKTDPQFYS